MPSFFFLHLWPCPPLTPFSSSTPHVFCPLPVALQDPPPLFHSKYHIILGLALTCLLVSLYTCSLNNLNLFQSLMTTMTFNVLLPDLTFLLKFIIVELPCKHFKLGDNPFPPAKPTHSCPRIPTSHPVAQAELLSHLHSSFPPPQTIHQQIL